MVTTIRQKNRVRIPAEVRRKLGIKPGWRLDWNLVEAPDEILIRVIPDRGEMAGRLLGAGRRFSPDRDSVAETRGGTRVRRLAAARAPSRPRWSGLSALFYEGVVSFPGASPQAVIERAFGAQADTRVRREVVSTERASPSDAVQATPILRSRNRSRQDT